MEITKDIINGVKVTYIKTNKFKTVGCKMFFKSEVNNNITRRMLLLDNLLKSSKKYNTNEKLAEKLLDLYNLSISGNTTRYGNNIITSLGFSAINDKFIESLKPILDDRGKNICMLINNFIENFNYLTGDDYFEHYDHERTLELEFLIIYNKIVEILQNPNAVEHFLYKICTTLEIDWSTISSLLRNISFISRSNTNQIMGAQQLRQEIFNLFYLKGFNKNEIGSNIFNKNGSIYYTKGYKKTTKDITKDEWEFNLTYTATLEWDHLSKDDVLKFIGLFKGFFNAGV